jgi:hypothetical protein
MKYYFYLLILSGILISCKEKELPENDLKENLPFKTDYKISDLKESEFFEKSSESKGKVLLKESSGLAYSKMNPGLLWTIQDKGNSNSLFLLDANTGEIVTEYKIKGAKNRDWESIELSTNPVSGNSYLYLGDTGDNNHEYEDYKIYRFREPKFEETHRSKTVELDIPIDIIDFDYPNKSHDVEALLVDPLTNDIFLVTKRDQFSLLYALPYPQETTIKNKAKLKGIFSFTIATAGTVSEDGSEVLIKTYDKIFFWKRTANQSFTELLATVPSLAPYEKELQGEAICFDEKGGYYTLSEWSGNTVPELKYYKRK